MLARVIKNFGHSGQKFGPQGILSRNIWSCCNKFLFQRITPEYVRDSMRAKDLSANSRIIPDLPLKMSTRKRKTGDIREKARACE